jgi:hypothetical protein
VCDDLDDLDVCDDRSELDIWVKGDFGGDFGGGNGGDFVADIVRGLVDALFILNKFAILFLNFLKKKPPFIYTFMYFSIILDDSLLKSVITFFNLILFIIYIFSCTNMLYISSIYFFKFVIFCMYES